MSFDRLLRKSITYQFAAEAGRDVVFVSPNAGADNVFVIDHETWERMLNPKYLLVEIRPCDVHGHTLKEETT